MVKAICAGPAMTSPILFTVISTSRCKVSGCDAAMRNQRGHSNTKGRLTRNKCIWYVAWDTLGWRFVYLTISFPEFSLGQLLAALALLHGVVVQHRHEKIEFCKDDDYWYCCHRNFAIGIKIVNHYLCLDPTWGSSCPIWCFGQLRKVQQCKPYKAAYAWAGVTVPQH